MLAYLPIFLFAAIDGEIYYVAMCVAAAAGKLHWAGVLVTGALGGSIGDQVWFYLLRGRIHWLDRYGWLARRRDAVVDRVKAHQNLMLIFCRFLPGLRIAIAVSAAYAGIAPLRFSLLSFLSGFLWASAIMLLVIRLGPDALSAIGLTGWWAPIVPAVLVIVFFRWLGRPRHQGH